MTLSGPCCPRLCPRLSALARLPRPGDRAGFLFDLGRAHEAAGATHPSTRPAASRGGVPAGSSTSSRPGTYETLKVCAIWERSSRASNRSSPCPSPRRTPTPLRVCGNRLKTTSASAPSKYGSLVVHDPVFFLLRYDRLRGSAAGSGSSPSCSGSYGQSVIRFVVFVVLWSCRGALGRRRGVGRGGASSSSPPSLLRHRLCRSITSSARERAMRRDVMTCGVVTTATSTATVTSAGRDRMARCGVWVGLSRDRPPHMPLDLTCKPSISRHTRRGSTPRAGAVTALRS